MEAAVEIEALTPCAFSPFGAVMSAPTREPDIASEFNRYWDQVVPFRVVGIPKIGFLRVRSRAVSVSWLERHLAHTQALIPLGGHPCVIAVALQAAAAPESTDVRVLLLDHSTGVVLDNGSWHHPLFPVVPGTEIMLLLASETMDTDMHMVQLPAQVGLWLWSEGEGDA